MSQVPAHLPPVGSPHIVATTDDFAIAYKPPHLLVHPTRPDGQFTLLEWLRDHFPGCDISLVNRLDRETSGLVIAALHTEAASRLGQMTMRREIEKQYFAVVHGTPQTPAGLIEAPLGRMGLSEENAIYLRQTVREDGAPARTEYEVMTSGGGFSLLRVRAHTGRLHQIRVHLSHVGHPVVGDKLYGPDPLHYLTFIEEGWTPQLAETLYFTHHALHAHSLAFTWEGETKRYQYPLSDDVADFILAHMPDAEKLLIG